ncbi:MAG: ECF transporter S component [Candidatus Odinarchaeota archaeon]
MSLDDSSLKEVLEIKTIALTVAFIAMVFIATAMFSMYLPASTGYFNLGEAFVYLAALIGGPIVGAIAGGLGSAMADMALGFPAFAPATLVLKGAEGFAAGFLYRFTKQISQKIRLLILSIISIFLVGFPLYISVMEPTVIVADVLEIPSFVLVVVALILCSLLWYASLFLGEKGQMSLACVLSGTIIVTGYFFYEILYGIPPVGALAEVPFNILQVLFGTFIAVPVISYLHDIGIIPEPGNLVPWQSETVKQAERQPVPREL